MRSLQGTNKNRTRTRRANLRRRQVGRGSRSKSRLQHQANDEQMNSLRKMVQSWLFVLLLQQWGAEKKHTEKVLPPQLLSFFPSLQITHHHVLLLHMTTNPKTAIRGDEIVSTSSQCSGTSSDAPTSCKPKKFLWGFKEWKGSTLSWSTLEEPQPRER
jgi:hypothetical protein